MMFNMAYNKEHIFWLKVRTCRDLNLVLTVCSLFGKSESANDRNLQSLSSSPSQVWYLAYFQRVRVRVHWLQVWVRVQVCKRFDSLGLKSSQKTQVWHICILYSNTWALEIFNFFKPNIIVILMITLKIQLNPLWLHALMLLLIHWKWMYERLFIKTSWI